MSIAPISGLGSLQLGSLQSPSAAEGPGGVQAQASLAEAPLGVSAGGEGGFSGALGKALESLEGTQAAAETAAAQVATGTSSDPEGAVVKVADAELSMQMASQLRTKSTEALQSIFQTQV